MYNQTTYNFTGFAIGNGITDWVFDADPAMYETFLQFNIIPQSLYDQFAENNCRFDVGNPYNNSIKC